MSKDYSLIQENILGYQCLKYQKLTVHSVVNLTIVGVIICCYSHMRQTLIGLLFNEISGKKRVNSSTLENMTFLSKTKVVALLSSVFTLLSARALVNAL